MQLFRALLFALLWGTASGAEENQPPARLVVIGWDGMRPDFVSEDNTPNLLALARTGVRFTRHHSAYPTATQVNGAVLTTGMRPGRSGLIANREFRPGINASKAVDTGDFPVIQRGDEISRGKYLFFPTVPEMVRQAGKRSVVIGSKSVVFLADRRAQWTFARKRSTATVFAAAPMDVSLREATQKLLGRFLGADSDTHAARNRYISRTLTEIYWQNQIPDYSFIWLSEPDLSQHDTAPGSPAAIAAIRESDQNLGIILRALEEKKARQTTDILVVSDHGFSTITHGISIDDALEKAGFSVWGQSGTTPQPGHVFAVGNGGSILFYIQGGEPSVRQRLVEWLQQSDFAGVIFTREKSEGTFPFEIAGLDSEGAPDVVVAMRWSKDPNQFGTAGSVAADARRAVGKGNHASLSRYDVHNILVAAGPHFRKGIESDLPSGNIDVAPTVLRILGIEPPHPLDGRVLLEAMSGGETPAPEVKTERLQAERVFPGKSWRQYLQISRVGNSVYLDEGNAE